MRSIILEKARIIVGIRIARLNEENGADASKNADRDAITLRYFQSMVLSGKTLKDVIAALQNDKGKNHSDENLKLLQQTISTLSKLAERIGTGGEASENQRLSLHYAITFLGLSNGAALKSAFLDASNLLKKAEEDLAAAIELPKLGQNNSTRLPLATDHIQQ